MVYWVALYCAFISYCAAYTLSSNTPMTLYNSFDQQTQTLQINQPIGIYTCGPTLHNPPQIGNLKTFVSIDVLKRWLLSKGYSNPRFHCYFIRCSLDHVCNLTDIDDKIIKKVIESKISREELTDRFKDKFFKDLKSLNVIAASYSPRPSQFIDPIINYIQSLLDQNLAYIDQGSVYFNTSQHPGYIRCNSHESINDRHTSKKDDFALWKSHKASDGNIYWESQWGIGRPGWHTECAVMSMHYLNQPVQIYAGGADLKFPHHTNTKAQLECFKAHGQQIWVHTGLLTDSSSRKLSKSLMNAPYLSQLCNTHFECRALRLLFASSHYRSPLEFSQESFDAAQRSLKRLDETLNKLNNFTSTNHNEAFEKPTELYSFWYMFERALDDDLNTPRAFAALYGLLDKSRKYLTTHPKHIPHLKKLLNNMNSILGIWYDPIQIPRLTSPLFSSLTQGMNCVAIVDNKGELGKDQIQDIPINILNSIKTRCKARSNHDFQLSDKIRLQLSEKGYNLKDCPDGITEIHVTPPE